MSYDLIGWVNDESALSAENFNHMDEGIKKANDLADKNASDIAEFAKEQIPEEYVKSAVDNYIADNEAGLALKEETEALNTKIDEEVGKLSSEMVEKATNLITDNNITYGGYYGEGGAFIDLPNFNTVKIPCEANDSLYFFTDNAVPNNLTITCFRENGGYISYFSVSSNRINVPNLQGISYIQVPVRADRLPNTAIYKTNKAFPYYIKNGDTAIVVDEVLVKEYGLLSNLYSACGGQWHGKTWYAYGTSLTSVDQGKYVPYLKSLSGLNVENKGIPGGALVANRNIYNALMDNTDGKVNADLITIEVGANDKDTPLGEVTSMDNTTFCGALNTCLKNILTNCPKAQVVIMPSTIIRHEIGNESNLYSLDSERGDGTTYLERDEAIRKIAVANGIYYIPFGSGLGLGLFREQSSDLYNVDQIHHTELGGYNLAQGMWGYLKNIPLWYNELPQ